MSCRSSSGWISLVTAVAAGAAVMYFLDPSAGNRRRRRVTSGAGYAWDTAKTATLAGSAYAAKKGYDAASGTGAYLADTGRHIGHAGHRASDATRHWGRGWGDYLRDLVPSKRSGSHRAGGSGIASGIASLTQWVGGHLPSTLATAAGLKALSKDDQPTWRDRLHDGWQRLTHRRQQDESSDIQTEDELGDDDLAADREDDSSHAFGSVLTGAAVTVFAAAGLMYFMDSRRGADRRASACRAVGRQLQPVGDMAVRVGRHLRGSLGLGSSGLASDPRGLEEDDYVLEQRVRSTLGHHTLHGLRQLQVEADHGVVTLRGTVSAEDYMSVVETAATVPGVKAIDNQLQTSSTMETGV